MLPADQLPPTPQSLWQAVKDLRRDIQQLRAARRLESAAIGAGGLSIVNGGSLSMVTPSGTATVQIGVLSPKHTDGSTQQGVLLWREDGTPALSIWNSSGSGPQPLQVYDKNGSIVLADDITAGGLARPYIPYARPGNEDITTWPKTSAGTWTTIARSRGLSQHPRVRYRAAMATDGTAAGQIRLCVDGTPVLTGAIGTELNDTASLPAFNLMADIEFTLQAQVTSGAGNVYGMTRYLYGVQS